MSELIPAGADCIGPGEVYLYSVRETALAWLSFQAETREWESIPLTPEEYRECFDSIPLRNVVEIDRPAASTIILDDHSRN